jgi:hypothetical protein
MTKTDGPYTTKNSYRIIPSKNQENKWWVQWRSSSFSDWFIDGWRWETDYTVESYEDWTTMHVPIEYNSQKEAEERIYALIVRDEKRQYEELQEEARERNLKNWSKSVKPRRVPPFMYLDDDING